MKRTPLKRNQKPLKKSRLKQSSKPKTVLDENRENTMKMKLWFMEIWDERQDKNGNCYCFETGQLMKREVYRENSACYDHVLEKQENQFPQYKFTKKNIVIILPTVHYQKGTNIDFTPKIKTYKQHLLELHYENKLYD